MGDFNSAADSGVEPAVRWATARRRIGAIEGATRAMSPNAMQVCVPLAAMKLVQRARFKLNPAIFESACPLFHAGHSTVMRITESMGI